MRFLWAVAMFSVGCFAKPSFEARDGGPDPDAPDASMLDRPPIGSCDPATIPNKLVALPFTEGTGAVAADETMMGHNGSIVGATWTTAGRIGTALDFGGNHYVTLSSPTELEDLRPLSLCAWVRLDALPTFAATIADKSLDGYTNGWNLFVEATPEPRVGFLSNYAEQVSGSMLVSPNTWMHVCATWDGTSGVAGMKLYRNGTVDPINYSTPDQTPTYMTDNNQPLVLGRQSNLNTYHLDGTIDEFFLFRGELTLEEVKSLYDCAPL